MEYSQTLRILWLALLLSSSVFGETELALPSYDWRPQDWEDSRGVSNVYYDAREGALILDCFLDATDDERKSGEIILELRYVPGLQTNFPLNLTQSLIEAVVDVPADFPGSSDGWNGFQVLVKDTNWLSEYGCWINCPREGSKVVYLRPSTNRPGEGMDWQGFMDPGFDPSCVGMLGLKVGLNERCTNFAFVGSVKLRHFRVSPAIDTATNQLPQVPRFNGVGVVTVVGEELHLNGEPWFVYGGNWRMLEYGQNFGLTTWFPFGNGVSRHRVFIGTKMDHFRRYGISLLRVGLFDDGRTLFGTNGTMVSYATFRDDVGTFLALAAAHGILVEFALLDFLIAGREEVVVGEQVRGYRQLIESASLRRQFMEDVLTPLLQEFASTNGPWVAVDIVNEPEWILSQAHGGAWESDTNLTSKATNAVDFAAFSNFITEAAETIRSNAPHLLVTMGTSCATFELAGHFDLNYWALHYYPWMTNHVGSLADFAGSLHARHPWSAGKPWVLEEYPGNGDFGSYHDTVSAYGGDGLLVWNLTPEIDDWSYSYGREFIFLQQNRDGAIGSWLRSLGTALRIGAVSSNGVDLAWESASGVSYQPEAATSLLSGLWQPACDPSSGGGTTLAETVVWTSAVPSQCFFRLQASEEAVAP